MCSYSMVGDHYMETLPKRYPGSFEFFPNTLSPTVTTPPVSREEFEALKRDIEDMKALLKRAKAYDEREGEPDCEMDEKVAFLRKAAQLVGLDLDDVASARTEGGQ